MQEIYITTDVPLGVRHTEDGFILGKTEVIVKPGIFKSIASELQSRNHPFLHSLGIGFSPQNKFAIITDEIVAELYANSLQKDLVDAGFTNTATFTVPPGEQSKTVETALRLINDLESAGYGRDDVVIAVGGGVIGDLGGYAASQFKRGIRLIQVPTTLLAQVDSCLGGKTGVDTEYGKNLIGTFYNPMTVFVDPELLQSLPDREYRSGLGEVIKYGVLDDIFLGLLEKNLQKLVDKDMDTMKGTISGSLALKASYVNVDPQDKYIRRILNFGHTVGQALETASNYELSHGEAIAIGMVYEGFWAVAQEQWPPSELDRLCTLLKRVGLTTMIPQGIDIEDLIKIMTHDKKITDSRQIEFWVPQKPSFTPLRLQLTEEYLRWLLSRPAYDPDKFIIR